MSYITTTILVDSEQFKTPPNNNLVLRVKKETWTRFTHVYREWYEGVFSKSALQNSLWKSTGSKKSDPRTAPRLPVDAKSPPSSRQAEIYQNWTYQRKIQLSEQLIKFNTVIYVMCKTSRCFKFYHSQINIRTHVIIVTIHSWVQWRQSAASYQQHGRGRDSPLLLCKHVPQCRWQHYLCGTNREMSSEFCLSIKWPQVGWDKSFNCE